MPFVLAALAGVALIAAFPPYGFGWSAFLGTALFFLALRQAGSTWRAAAVAFVSGAVFYGGLIWWIGNLGIIAWVPLVAALAAYLALVGLIAFLFRERGAAQWIVTAAAAWALMDLLRVRWPLGGFPWGTLGFAMGEYAGTRAAAQWIGSSGWTIVVVAMGASAAIAIERRRWQWLIPPLGAVLVLTAAGALWPPFADGNELRVAIVQADDPCPARHCPGERHLVYDSHLTQTRQRIAPGEVDLVVWAESSAGFRTDPVINPETAAEVGAEARRLGAYLMMGSDRPVSDDRFENVTILFSPEGEMVAQYQKIHAVPFGEYVPARPLFDWIPELDRVPRDMIRGDGPVVFALPEGRFGSVISFEAAFHRYMREHVADGANLIVVATNQASYGIAPASDQLIGITRMRAAELGVDIVHSAVTGRSTFISASGETGYRTGLYIGEVIFETVRFRTAGPTIYFRLGDWLAFLMIAAAVALEIRHRWLIGRRSKASTTA